MDTKNFVFFRVETHNNKDGGGMIIVSRKDFLLDFIDTIDGKSSVQRQLKKLKEKILEYKMVNNESETSGNYVFEFENDTKMAIGSEEINKKMVKFHNEIFEEYKEAINFLIKSILDKDFKDDNSKINVEMSKNKTHISVDCHINIKSSSFSF